MKSEADREVKERRSEWCSGRNTACSKGKKTSIRRSITWRKKEEAVQRRQAEADERLQEVERIKKSQFEMLEKVSGFSKEQAKDYMLQMLENELTHEKGAAEDHPVRAAAEGGERRKGPRDPFHRHSALRQRPCGRGHRFGGAAAQ